MDTMTMERVVSELRKIAGNFRAYEVDMHEHRDAYNAVLEKTGKSKAQLIEGTWAAATNDLMDLLAAIDYSMAE